ncbi:hypothetical protein CHARACLAT_018579 [Characodon lateralis]|uniref:Uncharacterized protein n=1 Tax=Characodon lateralis TaxID=208331 RepID=A0ABU7DA00_9TELE|nr:hypothetical protein [Characodon lateralis]
MILHSPEAFLEEASLLDPRFKSKIVGDGIWERVKAVGTNRQQQKRCQNWERHTGGQKRMKKISVCLVLVGATHKAEEKDSIRRTFEKADS